MRTASLLAFLVLVSLPLAAQPLLSRYSVRSPNSHPSGFFGRVIETIGDADGDGVQDFLVGASNEDPGRSLNNIGRAYYFSGADGSLIRTFDSPNAQVSGFFAVSAAAAGDVNGDGTPDFLAGSYHAVGGRTTAGRAYLISGADGATLRSFESPDPEQDGFYSFNVAAPGDLDGDGTGDYVIGAPSEDIVVAGNTIVDHGAAYAYSGADGSLLWTSTPQTQEASIFYGRVASVGGDLNGDGVPDLITSAVQATSSVGLQTGLAYAVDGSDGRILYQMESGNAAFNNFSGFGWSITSLSDLDGDGVRDIGVGAPYEGVAGTHVRDGSVSFFSGASGASFGTYFEEERQADRFFGWTVREVGDLNGDGVTEIGVSAPSQFNAFQDRPGFFPPFSGALFITSGADIGMASAEDIAEVYPTLPNFPTQFRWRFGEAFASLGDVDGDGLPDIAVGAPNQGNNFGFVGVFSGASILAISDVDVAAEDEQPITGDGTYGFASTAASLVLNSVTTLDGDEDEVAETLKSGGGTSVRVQRHASRPNGTEGITEAEVASYRWTFTSDGPLSFGNTSEARFQLSEIPDSQVIDPGGIVVYHRVSIGGGAFEALATSHDAASGQIVATGFTALGEFVFASDTNPLPSEPGAEASGVAVRAFPNPGAAAVTVEVTTPEAGDVGVAIHDVLGREVTVLHRGPLAAGTRAFALDASALSPGVYVVRVVTPEVVVTRRMTVVR